MLVEVGSEDVLGAEERLGALLGAEERLGNEVGKKVGDEVVS